MKTKETNFKPNPNPNPKKKKKKKKKKKPTKQFWVVLYVRKMGGLIEMNRKKTN